MFTSLFKKNNNKFTPAYIQLFAFFILLNASIASADNLKPFFLAGAASGDFAQTVIGVSMTKADMSNDTTIMKEVDFKNIRSTAHLPYEMLIHEDGNVYALNAKFPIAINFPDLSMADDHSFMGIMASPDAIKKALILASGGVLEAEAPGVLGF